MVCMSWFVLIICNLRGIFIVVLLFMLTLMVIHSESDHMTQQVQSRDTVEAALLLMVFSFRNDLAQ